MCSNPQSEALDGLRIVLSGMRLVIWTVLAATLVANIFGFLTALLGGAEPDLGWISFIPATGALLVVIGVYRLTIPLPMEGTQNTQTNLGRALRSLAVLDCLFTMVPMLVYSGPYAGATLTVDVVFALIGVTHPIVFLAYVRFLTKSLNLVELGQKTKVVAWILGVTLVVGGCYFTIIGHATEKPNPLIGHGLSLLQLAILVWAWTILWRFARALRRIYSGRCPLCDYDCRAMAQPRCPECGTSMSPIATMVVEQLYKRDASAQSEKVGKAEPETSTNSPGPRRPG